jgi:hypothetical protein
VRPHSDKTLIVQLDDLDESRLSRVRMPLFSPGKQVPVISRHGSPCLASPAPRMRKTSPAGLGRGRAPTRPPQVPRALPAPRTTSADTDPIFPKSPSLILHTAPGRVLSAAQLEALALVAEPEPVTPATIVPLRVSRRHENAVRARRWPDYQRCLDGAPESKKADRVSRGRVWQISRGA